MIVMVCSVCGSENVKRDAWAEWSVQEQSWVLCSTYDNTYCEDCEEEQSLEERELT